MLYRKIQDYISAYFDEKSNKILLIDGARQIGKTFIIRHEGQKHFKNYVEINLLEDSLGAGLFKNVNTVDDFYLQVSMLAGNKLKERKNTLIFLDEIQAYPHLLTLLKFLNQDGRFTYIASGSLLGVTLSRTSSIPMGSIQVKRMYPLDFEEFLWANGINEFAINGLRNKFASRTPLDESTHNKILDLFKKYLLVGGLPDAVNSFIEKKNIAEVRAIQSEIRDYYGMDAGKYDSENRLKIKRIYEMIPSQMENKKKRLVIKDIENKKQARAVQYADEFDYLTNAGIALEVDAVTAPSFPLLQSAGKNLLKFYMNDVGLLTEILYKNNIRAVIDSENSVNLGSVYESVVAQELAAHGHKLFYYDNRDKGEVDFLIDDYDNLSVLPLEVKSGKDYHIHSALSNLMATPDYHVNRSIVLSNEREIKQKNGVEYLPIYYTMFL